MISKLQNTKLMKRIVITLGILVMVIAASILHAQQTEGVITYEVRLNMHKGLPPERQNMKAMIPEFRTYKQELFFNANESLYKTLIEDEEEEESSGGGITMRFRQPKVETYVNQETEKLISLQEFFGKTYLINDTLKVSPWKFGTETKTIMGYECKQAFFTDESRPDRKQEITAWYTDKIRPFLGPESFGSLPGAVLAIDINNAERVIVCKKVELRPLKKNELKEPTSGEKVTRAEFRKKMDDQRKEMEKNGGRMIIRN
jgi:GLPGLI family protein